MDLNTSVTVLIYSSTFGFVVIFITLVVRIIIFTRNTGIFNLQQNVSVRFHDIHQRMTNLRKELQQQHTKQINDLEQRLKHEYIQHINSFEQRLKQQEKRRQNENAKHELRTSITNTV